MGTDYQEDFRTPGIFPSFASSRNLIRERPKSRRYPFDRPVITQRFLNREGDEFLGSFWSPSRSPAALREARFAAYFSINLRRFSLRARTDVFAMYNNKGHFPRLNLNKYSFVWSSHIPQIFIYSLIHKVQIEICG